MIASGILLGGLIRTGRAKRPPYEEDARAVAGQLSRLVAAGHHTFHMGHGGPLPAHEVVRHAAALQALGGASAQLTSGFVDREATATPSAPIRSSRRR